MKTGEILMLGGIALGAYYLLSQKKEGTTGGGGASISLDLSDLLGGGGPPGLICPTLAVYSNNLLSLWRVLLKEWAR